MEIFYRGRKSSENHISLLQLLKEKLVYNSILSIGGVCVGGCIYMHRIYVYEEKELSLWSVSLKHMASIFP